MCKKLIIVVSIVIVIAVSAGCVSTKNQQGLIYESDDVVWILHTAQKTKEPLLQRVKLGVYFNLALSNDLTRVAYSTDKYNLWIADVDGTNAKEVIIDQLRKAGLEIARISWSPGDKRLAVWGTPVVDPQANLDKITLYVVDLQASTNRLVATCARDFEWTRTGEYLVVNKAFCPEEAEGIYLITASDSTARQLFKEQIINVASIAVSPVKDEIAFVAGPERHLFIGDLSSGDTVDLLQNREPPFRSVGSLAWSPDGKHLAFIATLPGKNNLAISTLFIVDIQAHTIQELAQHIRGPIVWAPTGQAIATTVMSNTQGIYQVSLETGNIQKLTDDRLLTPANFNWR